MGTPNTDLMIREARQVISGPMAMLRLGTCGVVKPEIIPGDMMVPKATILLQQNYDYDPKHDKPESQFYISKPCPADKALHDLLVKTITESLDANKVHKEGIMATASTFYSAQGESCNKS